MKMFETAGCVLFASGIVLMTAMPVRAAEPAGAAADARAAFFQYLTSPTMADASEILSKSSAAQMASIMAMMTAMAVEGSGDAKARQEFRTYLARYNLHRQNALTDPDIARRLEPRARECLADLTNFAVKQDLPGLRMMEGIPAPKAREIVRGYTYTASGQQRVQVGPGRLPDPHIEAQFEDGRWRIHITDLNRHTNAMNAAKGLRPDAGAEPGGEAGRSGEGTPAMVVRYDKGIHTPPGPVALRIVSIENGMHFGVLIAPFDHVHFPESNLYYDDLLSFDLHPQDDEGRDVIEPRRGWHRSHYSFQRFPSPHFTSSYQIGLKKDASPESLRAVRGRVRLKIPVKVRETRIRASDFGVPVTLGGNSVTVTARAQGKQTRLDLAFTSDPADLLAVQGLDKSGGLIECSGGGGGGRRYTTTLKSSPAAVKIVIVEAFEAKEVPVEMSFDIKEITFGSGDAGVTKKFVGGQLTLQNFKVQKKSSKLALKLVGAKENIVAIQGYDAGGKEVRGGESTSMMDAKGGLINCSFQGAAEKVRIRVASPPK